MKYFDLMTCIKKRKGKYPQKIELKPLPFDPFSSKAKGCINAQVKAPISFSPLNSNRTHIYLIDESGSLESKNEGFIFQIGLLQGEMLEIDSLNRTIGELRNKWLDRKGGNSKFHHSKDLENRKQLFEVFCLKAKDISFVHYKINKKKDEINSLIEKNKTIIYFSALLSAIHDSQYSHGKIKIIASNRPRTFSDEFIYELERRARIQALIDMINHPIVGCFLPTIEFASRNAEDYPALDLCDYFISIIGKRDFSFQYKYSGCSLFETAENFEDWSVYETYYSNSFAFPEGRFLKFLKRKPFSTIFVDSIISRLMNNFSFKKSIRKCVREIETSKSKDDLFGAVVELSSRIGPYLDSQYSDLPLTEEEYLNIKSVGATFKLLFDYGIVISLDNLFSGKERFFQLNWR